MIVDTAGDKAPNILDMLIRYLQILTVKTFKPNLQICTDNYAKIFFIIE